MDNNLAYVKSAVIRDKKQHYVCSENSLYDMITVRWFALESWQVRGSTKL